jgi:hypothetical protein
MKTVVPRQIAQAVVAGYGLFLSVASAQVTVLSEFQRVDPFGQTIREDAQDSQREILSPAVARNAFASFQVVVDLPPGKQYYLHIGLNPEDAVQVKVYKEAFLHQADGRWIPDELKPVELPFLGKIGDEGIPGQKVEVYWLDVHVPKDAKVERIKVDPQLLVDQRWLSYPMEVRVVAAQVDGDLPKPGETAPIDLPVDASAQRVWRRKFCSISEITSAKNALTIRDLVERNARQDAALRSRWTVEDVTRSLSIADATQLCGEAYVRSPKGPESYLRLRDRILRGE